MLNWLKKLWKKEPTLRDGLYLRLEGKVYVVDVKDGKEEISELPGETTLQCLMTCLVEGLDIMVSRENRKKLEAELGIKDVDLFELAEDTKKKDGP